MKDSRERKKVKYDKERKKERKKEKLLQNTSELKERANIESWK